MLNSLWKISWHILAMTTYFHSNSPMVCDHWPILQSLPITESVILVLFPILVPRPTKTFCSNTQPLPKWKEASYKTSWLCTMFQYFQWIARFLTFWPWSVTFNIQHIVIWICFLTWPRTKFLSSIDKMIGCIAKLKKMQKWN